MISDHKIWRVLYTKPRFEKKVQMQLNQKEIESYLPLYEKIRKWSDRKKRIEEPLFSSYVFIHTNEKERLFALQTVGVVKCVMFKGEIAKVRDEEIENIKRLVEYGETLEVQPSLSIGKKVKITKGALANLQGVLTDVRGAKKFAITLDVLSSSILIEVPLGIVEEVVG